MTRLHPGWKEAVARISPHEPGWFVSDAQLEAWFEKTKGTDPFNLDLLQAKNALLWKDHIHLKRTEQDGIKGYRIATDQEKVDGYVEELQRRTKSLIQRQAHVINGVDPDQLDEDGVRKHEHQVRRSGLQLAFHSVLEANTKKVSGSLVFNLGTGTKEEKE